MNEKWMEEIRHNDEMTMLDRYFPGKSCGNVECEQHCIELCKIAEKMGCMEKNEISSAVARLFVFPGICPALKPGSNQSSCRFRPLIDDLIASYDDRTGRRIIGKKYISDADASKSGACQKCLEYANRIFKWPEEADQMPKLPLHPNCKCHYEDVYEDVEKSSFFPKKQFRVHFHVKGSPKLSKLFGGSQEFYGLNNLLDKLEKGYPPHSISYLIISNHGYDDCFDLGNGDDLKHIGNRVNKENLQRLQRMLAPNATIEIRMCQTVNEKGMASVQHIADVIGCIIIAYRNKVNIIGGKAVWSLKFPGKTIFYPKVDKK